MAEIPTNQQQVQDSVGPGGSLPMAATPDAFGANIGQSLSVGGEVANRLHSDAVQQFNTASVLDAHNRLNDFNQQAFFDPKNGVLNQNSGKDAPALVDKSLTDYDKQVDTLTAGLANDRQRESFTRLAQDNRRQIQMHLDSYESKQVTAYHNEVTQATAANAATTAIQNVSGVVSSNDPRLNHPETRAADIDEAAASGIEIGIAALREQAKFNSDPPEVTKQKIDAYTSAANYGVIQSLLSQEKDEDAQSYYDAHKKDLVGPEAVRAAEMVNNGTTFGEASRTVDDVAYDDNGSLRDRSEVESDLLKNQKYQSNERYAAAVDRQLDRRYRVAKMANDKEQTDLLGAAQKTLLDNGGNLDALQQSNPDGWAKLDGKGQSALWELSQKLQKRELPPSGSAPYSKLLIMSGSQDIDPRTGKSGEQMFKEMSPAELYSLAPSMSASDFKDTAERWQKLNATDAKEEDITGVRNFSQIAKASLAKAGLPLESVTSTPGNPKGKYNEETDRVLTAVATELDGWKLNNPGKKHIPAEVIQKAFDDTLLRDASTGKTRAMDIPVGTIASLRQADAGRLAEARAYLVANKMPVDNGTLLTAYNAMLRAKANPAPLTPTRLKPKAPPRPLTEDEKYQEAGGGDWKPDY